MNGTATKEEIEFFIEKYNERIQWNKEIRENFDNDFISKHPKVIGFIVDDILGGKKLTEENIDTTEAEIFEHEDNVQELHAFDMDDCHWTCYFARIGETEHEYKKKQISFLLRDVQLEIDLVAKELNDLSEKNRMLNVLLRMVIDTMKENE